MHLHLVGVTADTAGGFAKIREALVQTANFPGASSTQRTQAQQLYALLTGRITSINRAASLNETTRAYDFIPFTERNHQNEFAYYAQDTWKLTPRFTLDFGMRFAWIPPQTDARNQVAIFDPSAYQTSDAVQIDSGGSVVANSGNILNGMRFASDRTLPPGGWNDRGFMPEPRFGFAYDLFGTGKTALRVNLGKYLQNATNDENYWANNPALKPEVYDPEGAKKLLAEAGYPNGFNLTIHGPAGRYVNDEKIVQAVAQMLTRVGIVSKVETAPMAPYSARASKQEFSFHMVGWGASTGEASSPLRSLLATFNRDKGLGAVNWGRYSNPKVDYLIEQALQQVNDENRSIMLQNATKLAMEDLGIMPIHFQFTIWATKKNVAYTPRTDEYTLAFQFRPVGGVPKP